VGIGQTAGLVPSYQHGAALELAKAGFVTLTFELRGFGYLGSRVNTEHRYVAYNAQLGGSFYKAIIARDAKYATDLLRSFSEVDQDAIGVTGVSFGGELATTYAALDERIKVVVAQGHGGLSGPIQARVGSLLRPVPHYCMLIPGYDSRSQYEDMFLLVAPRPLLTIRGSRELPAGSDTFAGLVGKAYADHQVPKLFQFNVLPGGHEYFVQPAVEFFQRHLRRPDQIETSSRGLTDRPRKPSAAAPPAPPTEKPGPTVTPLGPPGQPVNVSE
jgi:hypothetical protein